MIENGRNEDLCRQMDALADEDHTHHLTSQEYFYYKSNGCLRSNKTGSNTVPVQRRADFKQALSTLQQLKQKEEEVQRNQQWAQSSSSSWWSWHGSWWTPYSYESHHGDEPSTDRESQMGISEMAVILMSLGVVVPANFKVAELFCRKRFGESAVDMGFERGLVVDCATG